MTQNQRVESNRMWVLALILILSLVSGFVDTAGFIGLSGLFTAHITGNLVLAGASIINGHFASALNRLAMLPIFMASVGVSSLWIASMRRNNRLSAARVLVAEAIALGVFVVVGLALAPQMNSDQRETIIAIVGGLGVVAMGIHNVLMRVLLPSFPATTVMTGNLTQFTVDLSHLVSKSFRRGSTTAEENRQTSARFLRFGSAVLGFLLGAVGGALGFANVGFASIFVPIALVLTAALVFQMTDAVEIPKGSVLSER